MPGTTPMQGLSYSVGTDNPKTIDDTMKLLAEGTEKKLVQVYTSTADRDAKCTAPTNGMLIYITGTNVLQLRVGSTWTQIYPPAAQPTISTGSTVPANSSGANGDLFFQV